VLGKVNNCDGGIILWDEQVTKKQLNYSVYAEFVQEIVWDYTKVVSKKKARREIKISHIQTN